MRKSFFLKTIVEELKENGILDKDILLLELDTKEYKNIQTPLELEQAIDVLIKDNDFKYLFISGV